MKDYSRRDAIKLGAGALAAASLPSFARAGLTATNNIGLALVPFTITNDTGKDVFMYAFGTLAPGSNPQIDNYFVSDLNGDCKKFPINAGPTPYGVKLTEKVTNANWPQLPGSRIYFSVGKQLTVLNTNVNGLPNAIIPNSTADPNFDTLWDFIEANWVPVLGSETDKSIEEKVKEIIVEHLGVNPDQVTRNASLIEDLGADSLDLVELLITFDEEFSVEVPDEVAEKLQTVGDIIRFIEERAETNTVFQWNVSQVNAFAIAFGLDLKGGTPVFPKVPSELVSGFGPGGLRAKIFADIAAAGAPWSNLIIPDPMGGVPLRVLQPYYSIHGVGPGSGFPADQLHDYVNKTIIPFYDESTTNRLVYAGLLPLQWKGFTSGGKFIFKPDNQATTTTYTFSAPTTGECYGNTIVGNPIDGNSGAIAAALGASILRSTLAFYTGFPVPQADRNLYYSKAPFFEYAKIIHKFALNNHAFCFGYDEVAQDNGEVQQVWNPTSLAVTIHGLS